PRTRMIGEPWQEYPAVLLLVRVEALEEGEHAARVETGAQLVLKTTGVGLHLVRAAEKCEQRRAADLDGDLPRDMGADTGEPADDGDAGARALRFLHLPHRVTFHHVFDLVAHD